jgi:hypothetical protein
LADDENTFAHNIEDVKSAGSIELLYAAGHEPDPRPEALVFER